MLPSSICRWSRRCCRTSLWRTEAVNDLVWKVFCPLRSPRPGWSGMTQSVCDGICTGQSTLRVTMIVHNEPLDCPTVRRPTIWEIPHRNEIFGVHGTTVGRIGSSAVAGGLCSEFCHAHADRQGHRQSSWRTFSCRCGLEC